MPYQTLNHRIKRSLFILNNISYCEVLLSAYHYLTIPFATDIDFSSFRVKQKKDKGGTIFYLIGFDKVIFIPKEIIKDTPLNSRNFVHLFEFLVD